MENTEMITCSSCGARFSAESDYCELCGWPVGQDDHDMRIKETTPDLPSDTAAEAPPPSGTETAATASPGTETSDAGVFCHMCGWENPPGARFCSSCGTKLQEAASKKKLENTRQKIRYY